LFFDLVKLKSSRFFTSFSKHHLCLESAEFSYRVQVSMVLAKVGGITAMKQL